MAVTGRRLAGAAVDAFIGVYVEHHVLAFVEVDAVNRADLDAGLILNVDTRRGDDVGHGDLLLGELDQRPGAHRILLPGRQCVKQSTSRERWPIDGTRSG
jgi:hypothetical protein